MTITHPSDPNLKVIYQDGHAGTELVFSFITASPVQSTVPGMWERLSELQDSREEFNTGINPQTMQLCWSENDKSIS